MITCAAGIDLIDDGVTGVSVRLGNAAAPLDIVLVGVKDTLAGTGENCCGDSAPNTLLQLVLLGVVLVTNCDVTLPRGDGEADEGDRLRNVLEEVLLQLVVVCIDGKIVLMKPRVVELTLLLLTRVGCCLMALACVEAAVVVRLAIGMNTGGPRPGNTTDTFTGLPSSATPPLLTPTLGAL